MGNSEQENHNTPNFYERYSDYTDSQIMNILRNQKNYQGKAINAAVKIALERQLIYSEQDLLSPEFQNSKDVRFSFFPKMPNTYHHNMLISSVFRFLNVFSLLPVVYAILKYSEGNYEQMIWGLVIGAAWFLLVTLFKRSKRTVFFILLLLVLIISGIAAGLKLFAQNHVLVADIIIFLVGVLLPAYFLFYAKKLADDKPEEL